MRLALALAALVVTALPARAEMMAGQALDGVHKGDKSAYFYIAGVFHGLQWADLMTKPSAGSKRFCTPPKLELGTEALISVVENQIKKVPSDRDRPFGLVLYVALMDVFPCE